MRDRLELALMVLLNSPKTMWAFVLGVVFFAGISMWGEHMAGNLEFHGAMRGIQDAIAYKIMHRYDRAAIIALIAFWALAIRCYRKDWKRLLS